MQIHTITRALEAVEDGCTAEIYSKSDYVCNAIEKNWVVNWAVADWMTRGKTPIKNRDLWEILFPNLKKCRQLTMHYVTEENAQSAFCLARAKQAMAGYLEEDPAYAPPETKKPQTLSIQLAPLAPPAPRKRPPSSRRNFHGEPVTIYTDGSCLGNPGSGGWAAIICKEDAEPKELSGGYRLTTNNRMEILSVIEALSVLENPSTVELYSDSQYVCNAIEKRWLKTWMRNNWQTATKKPVKNQDLWVRLSTLLENHKVNFHWLRGHAGHPENERCDTLARSYAERSGLPEDPGFHPANS